MDGTCRQPGIRPCTGLSPSAAPLSRGLLPERTARKRRSRNYNSGEEASPDFKLELFPLDSQLLRESWLVSSPPLIYMLKFSG